MTYKWRLNMTAKYQIGETVFHAGTRHQMQRVTCPDCKGTDEWKAISPAGDEFTFHCPRCNSHTSDLEYPIRTPAIKELTIGEVQSKQTNKNGKIVHEVRYMCEETGVGSGSIYDEAVLFPTMDQAWEAASRIAQQETVSDPQAIQRYNRALNLSTYHLNGRKNLDDITDKYCPTAELYAAWDTIRDELPPSRTPEIKAARIKLSTFFNRGALDPELEDENG